MSYDQVGVIPVRRGPEDSEVLIITSRTRGRWICPKGNVEEDCGPLGSARLEAFEEAGVAGSLATPALGTYQHGDPPRVTVCIWLMVVEEIHNAWPEEDERTRRWLPLDQARRTVDEEGLAHLIGEAATRLPSGASEKGIRRPVG